MSRSKNPWQAVFATVMVLRQLKYNLMENILVDKEGWMNVADMAETLNTYEGFSLTEADLKRAITDEINNGNPRLELNGGAVRVTSGQCSRYNEIYGDILPFPKRQAPLALYHGTLKRFQRSIISNGLWPGKRLFVHCTIDKQAAADHALKRAQREATRSWGRFSLDDVIVVEIHSKRDFYCPKEYNGKLFLVRSTLPNELFAIHPGWRFFDDPPVSLSKDAPESTTRAPPPPTSVPTNVPASAPRRRDPADQQEVLRTVAERVRSSPIRSRKTARTDEVLTSLHETCPLSRRNPEWYDQCGKCLEQIPQNMARYRCSEECLDVTYCEKCVLAFPLSGPSRTSGESGEFDREREFPPLATSHPPMSFQFPPTISGPSRTSVVVSGDDGETEFLPPLPTSHPPMSIHLPPTRMTQTSAPLAPPPADFFAAPPQFEPEHEQTKEKAKAEDEPPAVEVAGEGSASDTSAPTSVDLTSGSSSSSVSVSSAGARSRGVSRRSKRSQEKRKERWQEMQSSERSSGQYYERAPTQAVSSSQLETSSAVPAPVYYNFWGPTNVYQGGPPPHQQQPQMAFNVPTYPPQYPLQPMIPPQYPPPSAYPAPGYSGYPVGFSPFQ